MANSFFKFKNSISGLGDDEFTDLEEEEEYDALNDETFGEDVSENWEETHNLLAAATESSRGRESSFHEEDEEENGFDVERSLNRLVLDDDPIPRSPVKKIHANNGSASSSPWRQPFGAALQHADKSPPMPLLPPQLSRIPTVEELERQLMAGKASTEMPQRTSAPPPQAPPSKPKPIVSHNPPPGLFPPARPLNMSHPTSPPHPFPQGPPGFGGGPYPPKGKAAPKSVMGMYPPHGMMPHVPPEVLMMRNQHEKLGFRLILPPPPMGYPMMPPRMVPPSPPMMRYMPPSRQFYPQPLNPQMRNDGYVPPGARSNFHPLLQQQQQQQHMNWQQKQQHHNHHQPQQQQHHHNFANRRNNEHDEYAKLMNNRERTWLLNVQMMQLASDKPHIVDYYYTMWRKKQQQNKKLQNGYHKEDPRKKAEPFFANNRHNEYSRERKDSEGTTTSASPRVYVPLQFENSLGKLQCGSVTAPRKIIDMDIMADSQNGAQPAHAQKDYRKTKKILLEIERLYLLLMDAEEEEENEDDDSLHDLVNKVITGFMNDERFLSFLCVRKGKTLLLRCLGHVTDWENPLLCDLWSRMLKAFPTVLRRDRDDALIPKLYPCFKKWIAYASWSNLLTVARSLLTSTRDGRTSVMRASPSPSKPVLFYVLSNQFGISAVAKLLMQGELASNTLADNETAEWKTFVEELVKSVANLDSLDNVVRPIDPIPHNILTAILNRRCPLLSSHVHMTTKKLLGS